MRFEIEFWDNVHEIIIEEIELSHKKELDNMQEGKQPDQEKS